MKNFLLALVLLVSASFALSADKTPTKDYSLDLKAVPLDQVVVTVYGSILHEPYLLDDQVKSVPVTVSFAHATNDAVREVLDAYLTGKGITRIVRSGVNIFLPRGAESSLGPAALAGTQGTLPANGVTRPDAAALAGALHDAKGSDAESALSAAFVQLRHRPSPDLVKMLEPLAGKGSSVQPAGDDGLFLLAPAPRLAALKMMLEKFDRPADEVQVRATVVEYSTTDDDGAGFFGALQVLGGKLSVNFGDKSSLPNVLTFQATTFQAVMSAMSQDSRFSILDSSTIRVVSGKQGRLTIGQDVPVLNSFTLDAKGNPVQSVQYRSSGLILDLKPVVVGEKVHATLQQTISSFAVTNTSKIDSPTLMKREFETSLTADFGKVLVIGGLDETKDTDAKTGLFGWRWSNTTSHGRTTVFLVLEFRKA